MKTLKISLLLTSLLTVGMNAAEHSSFTEFNSECIQKLPTFLNHLENDKIKLKTKRDKSRAESEGFNDLQDYSVIGLSLPNNLKKL